MFRELDHRDCSSDTDQCVVLPILAFLPYDLSLGRTESGESKCLVLNVH